MYHLEINQKLKDSILSTIPANFSNLEKALYIYKQLCSKLQYSIEYFVDEQSVKKDFLNVENLKYVDGETNKDVVCFTFNAILGELLYEANVSSMISYNYGNSSGRFSQFHESVCVNIDGIEYDIDATYGILDNNDLTLSKYMAHRPQGWMPFETTKTNNQILDQAIEKVYGNELSHQNNVNKYLELKQKQGGYLELPFEERVQLFFEMMKDCPKYSILSFNYLLKLKHLLFSKDEFEPSNQVDKKFDLQFVKDRETNTLKAILFLNPTGYTNDMGYENFDDLSIYELDIKNMQVTSTDMESLTKKLNTRQYVSHRDDKTLRPFSMMSPGKLDIRPITDGKPIYDHHQNVVNAIGYQRKLLKENKFIPYEPGE